MTQTSKPRSSTGDPIVTIWPGLRDHFVTISVWPFVKSAMNNGDRLWSVFSCESAEMSLLDLDQYEDAIYDNLPRMKVRRGVRTVTAATMAKNHLVLAIALIAASGRNHQNWKYVPALHSLWCIRDLGFWRLEASLIIFRILIVFIPYSFPKKHIPFVFPSLVYPRLEASLIIFRIFDSFYP